jgi:hypothetical protein
MRKAPLIGAGLLLGAGMIAVAGAPAQADTNVSQQKHVALGFTASVSAFDEIEDSLDLCPPVPTPGLIGGGSYKLTYSGSASLAVDMGAEVGFAYDREDVKPGASVPVDVSYTPTDDAGPEVSVSASLTVSASAELEVCGSPNPSASGSLTLTAGGSANFAAPLGVGSSVSVPITSNSLVVEILGNEVVRATIVGNVTLSAVGPGTLPGLGGAAASIDVDGPAAFNDPFPAEWQASGASVTKNVTLNGTAGPDENVTVKLSPLHWVATAADFDLVVDVCCDLPDPDPISLFHDGLGSLYQDAGLDCLIGTAVDNMPPCGGFVGGKVAEAVAAGNVPIPLFDPPLVSISLGGSLPSLGSVDFTIDPDTDGDGIFDGTELTGTNPTDPDDFDSDNDGLSDGVEDANHNGAFEPNLGETNPNNSDTDADLLTDGCEVNGANPTDPLDADSDDDQLTDGNEDSDKDCVRDPTETDPNNPDSDADQLMDGIEVEAGTNPLDADSDDDGILDGEDTEWLQSLISALPQEAFRGDTRTAMLTELDNVEKLVAQGKVNQAVKELGQLRTHLDGCGTVPSVDDWIVDCPAQIKIRGMVDLLTTNLTS